MIFLFIDESGPIAVDMLRHCIERTDPRRTWGTPLFARLNFESINLKEPMTITFDIKIEEYHPELLPEEYLPPEETFCHKCRRIHHQNFCVRNGRSKHFQVH